MPTNLAEFLNQTYPVAPARQADGGPAPSDFLPSRTSPGRVPLSAVERNPALFEEFEDRRQRRELLSRNYRFNDHIMRAPTEQVKELNQLENIGERIGGGVDLLEAFVWAQIRESTVTSSLDPRSPEERLRSVIRPRAPTEEGEVSPLWDVFPAIGETARMFTGWLTTLMFPGEEGRAAMEEAFLLLQGRAVNRYAQRPTTATRQQFESLLEERRAANEDTLLGQSLAFGQTMIADPLAFGQAVILDNVLQMTPVLAASFAAALVSKNPNVFAGVIGAGSFSTEKGAAALEFFGNKGIDISDPEQLLAVLDDRELIAEADAHGHTRALIIGAIDMLAARLAGVPLGRTPVGNSLRQTGVQMVSGGAGEAIAQGVTTGRVDMADVLLEAFGELGMVGPELIGASLAGRQQRRASTAAELLNTVRTNADRSRLRQQNPELFREFLENAAERNGPVNLYVDAKKLNEFFQSSNSDASIALRGVQGVNIDSFRNAVATGGDIVIPIASFATDLAGTPLADFLVENARMAPQDISQAAAQEETAPEAIAEIRRFNQEAQKQMDEIRQSVAEIEDTVREQLVAAGRTEAAASMEATLFGAAYSTLAARGDLNVEELKARIGLPTIKADVDTGGGQGQSGIEIPSKNEKPLQGRGSPGPNFPTVWAAVRFDGETYFTSGSHIAIVEELIQRFGERAAQELDSIGGESFGFVASAAGANAPDIGTFAPSYREAAERVDPGAYDRDTFDQDRRGSITLPANLADGETIIRLFESADLSTFIHESGHYFFSLFETLAKEPNASVQMKEDYEAVRQWFAGNAAEIANEAGVSEQEVLEYLAARVPTPKDLGQDGDRLVRAAILGFDTTKVWYHGTSASFEAFRLSRTGQFGPAIYFTDFQPEAVDYSRLAKGGDPKVIPVFLRMNKPFKARHADEFWNHFDPDRDAASDAEVVQRAKDQGYDGVVLELNETDLKAGIIRGRHAIVFDPANARSTDAEFALDKSESALLLAQSAVDIGSTAFQKWFADSKVVDGKGKPLVVYHGTSTDVDIKAFDPKKRGSSTHTKTSRKAFWFSASRDNAMEFANLAKFRGTGNRPQTVAAYLSLQNPLEVDAKDLDSFDETIDEALAKGHDGVIFRNAEDTPQPPDLYIGENSVGIDYRSVFMSETLPDFFDGKISREDAQAELDQGVVDIEGEIRENTAPEDLTFLKLELRNWTKVRDAFREDPSNLSIRRGKGPADVFAVFDPTQIKSADKNRGAFDPNDPNIFNQGGDNLDPDKSKRIEVALQEQWARAFEQYIFEGNAPSAGLKGVFNRMRAWLANIYRQVRALNVNLSDDVREVMSRILATDTEIEAARQQSGSTPLFTDAEMAQLDEPTFRNYLKKANAVADEAQSRLLTKALEPFRKARDAKAREAREGALGRATALVNAEPIYNAFDWLANKVENFGAPLRLSRREIVERYGADKLKEIDRNALGGKRNVFSDEDDSRSIDEIAEITGYSSGDELIQSLTDMVPKDEAIEARVDEDMRRFFAEQDPTAEQELEEQAIARIHNAEQQALLEFEAEQLARIAGVESRDVLNRKSAVDTAKDMIDKMSVREAMNPQRFLTAERTAANNARAALAKTMRRSDSARDTDKAKSIAAYREALRFKQQQMLNAALYTESLKVAKDVAFGERLVRRLRTKKGRAGLAGVYYGAIDEILNRYDFKKTSAKADQQKVGLQALLDQLEKENRLIELAIPASVLKETRQRPYKTLTTAELRGVVDSLRNIQHIARNEKKLQDAWRSADLDNTARDVVASLMALPDQKQEITVTPGQKRKRGVKGILNTIVFTAETIMRSLDGFKDLGAVQQAVGSSIFKGSHQKANRLIRTTQQVNDIFGAYSAKEKTEMSRRVYIPELDRSMTKWELLSLALNVGNEGNYARLTNSRATVHFTPEQVQIVLDKYLTQRDMTVIQNVWTLIDSFWPEIEARELRVTGVVPERVARREVHTAHGTFEGGYFPIRYDPRYDNTNDVTIAEEETDLNLAMSMSKFAKAQTRRGHLEERKSRVNRSLYLDAGTISTHLNAVIHDLALGEAVRNADRVLEHGAVKNAFAAKGREADRQALKLWLLDVAAGDLMPNGPANNFLRHLRGGFTISRIAMNFATIAVQATGVFQSAAQIGYGPMLRGFYEYLKRPPLMRDAISKEIMEKSVFMRERQKTFHKDVLDFTDHMNIDVGNKVTGPFAGTRLKLREIKNFWITPASMFLMQKVQFYVVDIPTWIGAYGKEIRRSGSEEKAIEFADRTVSQTQASGLVADRTAMERGRFGTDRGTNSELVKVFTTLMSYMTRKINVAYDMAGRTKGQSLPVRIFNLAVGLSLLYIPEIIFMGLVRGGLQAMFDDDDDEDNPAGYIATEMAYSLAGGVPFVSLAASEVRGYGGGGTTGSIAETYGRAFTQLGQFEFDRSMRKALIDLTGTTFALPAVQINRMWDWLEQEDAPLPEFFFGSPPR